MKEKLNLSLQEYASFIKREEIAKPVKTASGIFLDPQADFSLGEVVLFENE